jgi:hypothetical protein
MKYIDVINLFKIHPNFNISGKTSISTLEGKVLSIFMYLISISIISYNFAQVYKENSPIIKSYEQIRNSSILENIRPEFFTEIYRFYNADWDIGLVQDLYLTDLSKSVFYKYNQTNFPEYNLDTTNIGTLENFDVPNDNFENQLKFNFDNLTEIVIGGNSLGKSNYIEYENFIRFDNCDLSYNKSGLINTNENRNYDICLENLNLKAFGISIDFTTQLLSPNLKDGFQTFALNKFKEYNPLKNDLQINYVITINELETDHSMIYSFGSSTKVFFYEKEMNFELIDRSNPDFSQIYVTYNLGVKKNLIFRSYSKIDEVLAASLSILQVIYTILQLISNFLSKHAVEYEIINNWYYEANFSPSNRGKKNSILSNGNIIPNNINKVEINENIVVKNAISIYNPKINTNSNINIVEDERLDFEGYKSNRSNSISLINCEMTINNNNISRPQAKVNLNNYLENISEKSSNSISKFSNQSNLLINSKIPNNILFYNFKSGLKNIFFSIISPLINKGFRRHEMKKNKLAYLAETEFDVVNIVGKLIQHEYLYDNYKSLHHFITSADVDYFDFEKTRRNTFYFNDYVSNNNQQYN